MLIKENDSLLILWNICWEKRMLPRHPSRMTQMVDSDWLWRRVCYLYNVRWNKAVSCFSVRMKAIAVQTLRGEEEVAITVGGIAGDQMIISINLFGKGRRGEWHLAAFRFLLPTCKDPWWGGWLLIGRFHILWKEKEGESAGGFTGRVSQAGDRMLFL